MESSSGGVAIRVEGLSKRYRLGPRAPYRRLGESIAGLFRSRNGSSSGTVWALRDVSLVVRPGEIVGVIGRNGAGKTTLLRVLSRITRPTSGRAEIFGRVGSLLEVGTGFHPELSGRENVFLNGAILGMQRAQIAERFDDIVAFAQLEEFMDTAVKHYSSGMRVRLAFAVAAHLDPEILFVDEVLAVGDASFQQRSLGRLADAATDGRTVLFVSHNMGMITNLCSRVIWIDDGAIRMDGEPQAVVEAYLSTSFTEEAVWTHPAGLECGEEMRVTAVQVCDAGGTPSSTVAFDAPFTFRVSAEASRPLTGVSVALRLTDVLGNIIFVTLDTDTDPTRADRQPGTVTYDCTVPGSLLRPGRYLLSVQARRKRSIKLDDHENCLTFEIAPIRVPDEPQRQGVITPVLDWTQVP